MSVYGQCLMSSEWCTQLPGWVLSTAPAQSLESTSFKRGMDESYPATGENKWKKHPRRQGLRQVLEQYFLKNKNETKCWEQGLESKLSDPQSS